MNDDMFPPPPDADASPYEKPLAAQFNRFLAAVFPTLPEDDVDTRGRFWMIFVAGARALAKAGEIESTVPVDDIAATIVVQMMLQELDDYRNAVESNLLTQGSC